MKNLRKQVIESKGNLNVHCLKRCTLFKRGPLWGKSGRTVTVQSFREISQASDTVEDVLKWRWNEPYASEFRCTSRQYPLSRKETFQFKRLVLTLVANYPEILYRADPVEILRPRNIQDHTESEWMLKNQPNGYGLVVTHWSVPPKSLGIVRSLEECERKTNRELRSPRLPVLFYSSPLLTSLVELWNGPSRRRNDRAIIVHFCRKSLIDQGTALIEQSKELWKRESPTIAKALDSVSWSSIHRLHGSAARDRRLLYRIKGRRLPMWDSTQERMGCFHETCRVISSTTYTHMLWECPAASAI